MLNISKFSQWSPFSGRENLFTGCYTGSWIYQKDIHEYFRYFELLIGALAQILTKIYQFQNLTHFVTINDVMNTRLYKCSQNLLIPTHRKLNDDIFAGFLVIMKNVISFIKEYRGPTFRPPCDVIGDVIIIKNTLNGIIWDDLFISEVKLKLYVFNISKCLKWTPFWARDKHFSGSDIGSWIYQKDTHSHFRYLELLIDALAQILPEIYQFQNLTYFVTWWRHRWRHKCVKHNLHN